MTDKKININKTASFNVIGIFYVLIGFLGMIRWGFVGRLVTNVFRVFVGNTYPFLGFIFICYGLLLILLKKEIKFKRVSLFYGLLLCYVSVLCLVQLYFPPSNQGADISSVGQTLSNLLFELKHNSVTRSVGGGLIGGTLFQASWFLFKTPGVILLGGLLGLLGMINVLNIKKNREA